VAVLLFDACLAFVADRRGAGARIVFTEGVFDLLHPGHVRYLDAARALGDVLVVGVTSDAAVEESTGKSPVVPDTERAELVAALAVVDAVTLLYAVSARGMIDLLRPDVVAIGREIGTLEASAGPSGASDGTRGWAHGADIVPLPLDADWSSDAILAKIRSSR
jgi:rfaE bifunctional protein nucleotidyltransferase chain/domain